MDFDSDHDFEGGDDFDDGYCYDDDYAGDYFDRPDYGAEFELDFAEVAAELEDEGVDHFDVGELIAEVAAELQDEGVDHFDVGELIAELQDEGDDHFDVGELIAEVAAELEDEGVDHFDVGELIAEVAAELEDEGVDHFDVGELIAEVAAELQDEGDDHFDVGELIAEVAAELEGEGVDHFHGGDLIAELEDEGVDHFHGGDLSAELEVEGGDCFDGGDLTAELEVEGNNDLDGGDLEADFEVEGGEDYLGEYDDDEDDGNNGGDELRSDYEDEVEIESTSEFVINLPVRSTQQIPTPVRRFGLEDDDVNDLVARLDEMDFEASRSLREMATSSRNAGSSSTVPNRGLSVGGTNEEERGGDLGKKVKDSETASSSEEKKENVSEKDGVSCSICLEPWTTDGDHSICCLPCGHVYGMSCIKSWLQQPNSGKCPQCSKVCGVEGIRKIYGLTIGAVDQKELQEKIQLLEGKCASLKLNDADWHKKEAEWREKEARLLLQLKPDTSI